MPATWQSRLRAAAMLLGLLGAGIALPAWAADPLEAIQQRGEIRIGVRTDYPLFSSLSPTGEFVGFEVDLAHEIARRLGVTATLVGVTPTERLQKVEDGSINLVIATLGDTEDRRRLANLPDPDYYASGVNMLAPPGTPTKEWAAYRGQTVCSTQGAYFNRQIAERYLIDLQIHGSNRDAQLALRNGRCVGWLQDDTLILSLLTSPEWQGWTMPLPSALVLPWSMALARSTAGTKLDQAVSDIIADWHRSGFLIATEKRWGLRPSAFLQAEHKLFTETDASGQLLCRRDAAGEWPQACRNRALLTSTDVSGLTRLGLLLKERTGVDLSIIYDGYDRAHFAIGLAWTLGLVVLGMAGSILVGCLVSLLLHRRIPGVSGAVRGFFAFLQLTPPLLQLYIGFFGIGAYLVGLWGGTTDPFVTVVICLSLWAGGQIGMAMAGTADALAARVADFRYGFRTMSRALLLARDEIFVVLLDAAKLTGIASVIAVPEVINATTSIMADRGNVAVMMHAMVVAYVLIIVGAIALFSRVQRNLLSGRRTALAELAGTGPTGTARAGAGVLQTRLLRT